MMCPNLAVCVLKGKTTTSQQFTRLINSLCIASEYSKSEFVSFFFYIDEGEVPDLGLKDTVTIHRVGDPGDLRNDFMSYLESEGPGFKYFTFLDGDDTVKFDYFDNIRSSIIEAEKTGKKLIIGNPIAVYDEKDISQKYSLKWVNSARSAKIVGDSLNTLAINDKIGGQCWCKVFSTKLFEEGATFGKGLYEDVPWWVEITRNLSWDEVLLAPNLVYYWFRNNQGSLTRIPPTSEMLRNSISNIARFVRLCEVLKSDGSWRRVVSSTLTLYRNITKIEDAQEKGRLFQTLRSELPIDLVAEKWSEYKAENPRHIKVLGEDCPGFERFFGVS